MKGFLGISGAILIQVYHTVLEEQPTSFILMLALLPSINSLLLMWFVKIIPTTDLDEKKHLNAFSLVSHSLVLYLMVVIIIQNTITLQLSLRISLLVILTTLLLVLPLCVALRAHKQKSNDIVTSLLEHNQTTIHGELASSVAESEQVPLVPGRSNEGIIMYDDVQLVGENLNLLQALCTVNFWLLFLTSACGMGSGIATVNNLSQIGESLGYSKLRGNHFNFLMEHLEFPWSVWIWLSIRLLFTCERYIKAIVYSHYFSSNECWSCDDCHWFSWCFTPWFCSGRRLLLFAVVVDDCSGF